jgi:hypothetical protein
MYRADGDRPRARRRRRRLCAAPGSPDPGPADRARPARLAELYRASRATLALAAAGSERGARRRHPVARSSPGSQPAPARDRDSVRVWPPGADELLWYTASMLALAMKDGHSRSRAQAAVAWAWTLVTVSAVEWHIAPATVKIGHQTASIGAESWSSKSIDLAGMRGECERTQVVLRDANTAYSDVQINFAVLHTHQGEALENDAAFGTENWNAKQQGYVRTSCPGGAASCQRGAGYIGPPGGLCLDGMAGETVPHNCTAGWKPDRECSTIFRIISQSLLHAHRVTCQA